MDLRIKKTHKLLVEALFKLLKEKPFEKIKLNEICEEAMIHKTTFYNHFEDKYDLLKFAITELQKNMLNQMNDTDDFFNYYLNLAYIYMKHIKENKEFYYAVFFDEKNSICLDIFYNLFTKDIEDKLNKIYNKIPINYLSHFYFSGVFEVVREWFRKGMKEDEQEIVNYLKILLTIN